MKYSLIAICMFWIAGHAFAQNSQSAPEGKIVYESVTKIEVQLEGDASQFSDMLPKEQKSKKVLYFTPQATLYKNYDEAENNESSPTAVETESVMIQVHMVEPDNMLYTDLDKNRQTEQREFMSRRFLIHKDLTHPDWKFTGNAKTVADYNCMEAYYMDKDNQRVTAWFTPEIPVASGPGETCGLPGMVLAVDFDNGERTITALSIDLEPVDKDLIKKPKKGKKVSEEEYDAIVQEKMKEMGAEGGEGSGVQTVIKIQR